MNFIKFLLAASALILATGSAQAETIYRFSGTADSGSAAGSSYEGELRFEDVAADFDGWVPLTALQLQAFGHVFTLTDAEPDTNPVAWWSAGQFLGVDFQSAFAAPAPWVALVAGFFDLGEAYLAYGSADGVDGFGSLRFERVADVPEPTTAGLLILGLAGLLARRRVR